MSSVTPVTIDELKQSMAAEISLPSRHRFRQDFR